MGFRNRTLPGATPCFSVYHLFFFFFHLPRSVESLISSLGCYLAPEELSSITNTTLIYSSYFLILLWSDTLFWCVEISGFTVNYCVCTFQSNMPASSHILKKKEFFFPHSTPLKACLVTLILFPKCWPLSLRREQKRRA